MTNANALPHRKSLRPALLWAAGCLLMLGLLVSLLPGARLNSSVLAMLPTQTLGRSHRRSTTALCSGSTVSWSGWSAPAKPDPRVAQQWLTLLQRSGALSEVKGPMDAPGNKPGASFSGSTATG